MRSADEVALNDSESCMSWRSVQVEWCDLHMELIGGLIIMVTNESSWNSRKFYLNLHNSLAFSLNHRSSANQHHSSSRVRFNFQSALFIIYMHAQLIRLVSHLRFSIFLWLLMSQNWCSNKNDIETTKVQRTTDERELFHFYLLRCHSTTEQFTRVAEISHVVVVFVGDKTQQACEQVRSWLQWFFSRSSVWELFQMEIWNLLNCLFVPLHTPPQKLPLVLGSRWYAAEAKVYISTTDNVSRKSRRVVEIQNQQKNSCRKWKHREFLIFKFNLNIEIFHSNN